MSTRMSDWRPNPLVALFFAVELEPKPSESPLVYQYPIGSDLLQQDFQSYPLFIQHTRVIQPVNSHRSEAQAAWHIVHAIHTDADGEFRFHPLDIMPPHRDRISRVIVSKSHVQLLRTELLRMGMTPIGIYGDFGSFCRSIAPTFGLS